jgi:hypothetical protein
MVVYRPDWSDNNLILEHGGGACRVLQRVARASSPSGAFRLPVCVDIHGVHRRRCLCASTLSAAWVHHLLFAGTNAKTHVKRPGSTLVRGQVLQRRAQRCRFAHVLGVPRLDGRSTLEINTHTFSSWFVSSRTAVYRCVARTWSMQQSALLLFEKM